MSKPKRKHDTHSKKFGITSHARSTLGTNAQWFELFKERGNQPPKMQKCLQILARSQKKKKKKRRKKTKIFQAFKINL